MKHTFKTLLITSALALPTTFGANAAGYQEEALTEAQEGRKQTQLVSKDNSSQEKRVQALPAERLFEIIGRGNDSCLALGYCDFDSVLSLTLVSKKFSNIAREVLKALRLLLLESLNGLPPLTAESLLPKPDPRILRFYNLPSNNNSFVEWLHILIDRRFQPLSLSPELTTGATSAIARLSLTDQEKSLLIGLFPRPQANLEKMQLVIMNARNSLGFLVRSNIPQSTYVKGMLAAYQKSLNLDNPEHLSALAEQLSYSNLGKSIELWKSLPLCRQTPTSQQLLEAAETIMLSTSRLQGERRALCDKEAADLCKISIKPDYNPTLVNMLKAAQLLSVLGSKHRDPKSGNHVVAAEIFKQVGTSEMAEADNVISAADGLKALGAGYYDQAAELYVKFGTAETATVQEYMLAADRLKALGAGYYDQAAELYVKVGTAVTATVQECMLGADRLKALGKKYYDISSKIYFLSVQPEKQPTNEEIDKVVKVLRDLNKGTMANEIQKKLSTSVQQNQVLLRFFKTTNDGVRSLFRVVLDSTCSESSRIYYAIKALSETSDPKLIEICSQLCQEYASSENAQSNAIIEHADILRKWGKHEDAVRLYRLSLDPNKKPGVMDFRMAAEGLAAIGEEHSEGAAGVYVRSVDPIMNPTMDDLKFAAEGVVKLGSEYFDKAMELYARITGGKEILEAAQSVLQYGNKYHTIVARLYMLVGDLAKANSEDVMCAAEGLIGLGSEHYINAGVLYVRSLSPDKSPARLDLINCALGLNVLAVMFPIGSQEREDYMKKSKELLAQPVQK